MESNLEFTGTTYQEWLEHHNKYVYPALVDACLKNCSHEMEFWKIKKEK